MRTRRRFYLWFPWTCQKHLAASDFYKLSSLGSLAQHYNGSRATYMHDRQQYVRIASEMSVMRTQVPQRSVLGPALFDVYINNLPSGYWLLLIRIRILRTILSQKKPFKLPWLFFLKYTRKGLAALTPYESLNCNDVAYKPTITPGGSLR